MMAGKLEPISDLPRYHDWEREERPRMTWDLELPPGVDPDHIGVNTRRLNQILTVASLRAVHMLPGTGPFEQPSHSAQLRDDYDQPELMRYHGRSRALIVPSVEALTAHIEKLGRGLNASRERLCAAALDTVVREKLAETVSAHLVIRSEDWRTYGGTVAALAPALLFDLPTAGLLLSTTAVMSYYISLLQAKRVRKEHPEARLPFRRVSATRDAHFGRCIAATAMLKTSRLIVASRPGSHPFMTSTGKSDDH